MQSFLEEVIGQVRKEYPTLEEVVFVLPNKRAGSFLRNAIARTTKRTSFSPEIYSIEGFVEKVSGLTYASNTQQLFELYEAYLKSTTQEKDNFFDFSKWGQTLVQDFNEIDRYLIHTEKLFSNLSAIQEINHWSLQAKKTKMIENYLAFWNNLEQLYTSFNKNLLMKGLGHQGMVYRHASKNIDTYLKSNSDKTYVFVGFNALNTAESHIIQTILKTAKADIFWDTDTYFLNDQVHDASFFIRKHKKTWPYLTEHKLKGVGSNYSDTKNIQITGIPKNVSQAKYVGSILKKLAQQSPDSLKNTAVVLADESLLNPVLNAVPPEIEAVNITMGYPLNKTPLASLFDQFIELYIHQEKEGWFYQKILALLSHPYIHELLNNKETNDAIVLSDAIKSKNWTYVNPSKIKSIANTHSNLLLLFFNEELSPKQFINRCLKIILELKLRFTKKETPLALEYLYRFYSLFNQVLNLIQDHSFINNLKSLQSLYRELLSAETTDFQGEALEGLQIMGMLESRNLDFETVIITSVNEGILPSGKSNNSFIPFDLKTSIGLPTYKEKDAIYTYHFYRLLQRAKNIYILYNTEPDVLEGGEKSRLILQLLTDTNKIKDITAKVAAPRITPTINLPQCIEKDVGLLELVRNHARKGFSPTSLSNYIRNPIDFYKRNLLGIDDKLEVEETIAANTFGTIIHDTLENLYTPFIGQYLDEQGLTALKPRIPVLVKTHFAKSYMDGDITRGKNLIAYKVIIRYIENFIDLEIREANKHQIKIISLEEKMSIELNIPGVDFPIILKGKLDRVDCFDGVIRIIDYKTGKVESKHVEIVDWEEIISEHTYSKAFQLLCYALMYSNKNPIDKIESGIISFKNLKAGLLRFATKDKKGSRVKDRVITQETLIFFIDKLKELISEICDPEIAFTEKEVK